MESSRRLVLAQLCVVLLVATGFASAAWFLPDVGMLGLVGTVLGFAGVTAVLGVPCAIWAVIAPGAARRWDEKGHREPLPLAVPIFWWLLLGGTAWALTHVEPSPTTRADYGGLALVWWGWGGGLAFAVASSVMYLRRRCSSAGRTDQGTGAS
ncbi:hypothetical protein [Xylanimonas sp. McL0601]|uniref:hypothetical protein n=1 Tax=Xylanimonas sp. McL0601 TaxID=3414739 RepID=UPI003CFB9C8A